MLNPAQWINLVAYWSASWHAALLFLRLLSGVEHVLCTVGCSWLVRSRDAHLCLELHTEWWWWRCDWQLSITSCRCWCGGWRWSSSPADDGARQLHHCTRLRGQSRQFCSVYLCLTWPAFFVQSIGLHPPWSVYSCWPSSANMPELLCYQDNALIAEMLDAAFIIIVLKSRSCYWYLLMCCNKLWLVRDPQMLLRFEVFPFCGGVLTTTPL